MQRVGTAIPLTRLTEDDRQTIEAAHPRRRRLVAWRRAFGHSVAAAFVALLLCHDSRLSAIGTAAVARIGHLWLAVGATPPARILGLSPAELGLACIAAYAWLSWLVLDAAWRFWEAFEEMLYFERYARFRRASQNPLALPLAIPAFVWAGFATLTFALCAPTPSFKPWLIWLLVACAEVLWCIFSIQAKRIRSK